MTAGQVKSNGSACDPADDKFLALFSALASSPHEPVEVIETHAARVYLAGPKAYKMKKRVKLPYLDFSSLDARQRMLLRELELNCGHAPEIYIGVMPISRASDGSLALGHDGEIIDYALVMNRFEQDSVLARVAGSGPLSPPLSRALAEMVAAYHRCAAIARDADGAGIMLATIAQLADELADAKGASTASAAARFRDLSFQELGAISSLLNQRGSSGHVRRCHGDLHLGNIVLLSGRPVPFDALEFDERLATIDVLYDLAFLIMDLDFRGDRAAANLVLNSYIGAAPVGGELDGLKCLPLFLATRAAIRAVVASQRARQQPIAKSADDARAAGRYLNAANTYLKPPRPSLVAVGGLSGTGKSTLGAALAPHIGPAPGALHLRSDVERKRHFGVAETERLTAQHYSEAISGTVYRILLEKAESALKAGHAVIIDAVAAKRSERDQMAALAQRTGAVFAGLWLECPFATMVERVAARHGDASDADAAVVAAQSHYDIGKVTWAVIDARGAPADLLEAARTQLRSAGLIP